MDFSANMECLLKVNVHCDACRIKMSQVLSSISGVYSVSIDAMEGTIKVSGEVNPNLLLKALSNSDKHAELVWVKLKHPFLDRRLPHYSYGATDQEPYSYHNNGYVNSRSLGYPQQSYETYQQNHAQIYESPSYYYPNNLPLPPARHVPSAPSPVYDPYENYDSISLCSIM